MANMRNINLFTTKDEIFIVAQEYLSKRLVPLQRGMDNTDKLMNCMM